MEKLDLENIRNSDMSSGILETFGSNALDNEVTANLRPEKRLQAQILSEMMTIDKQRAIITMRAWAKFVQLASQTRTTQFRTLAEYIPARVIDAGELWVSPTSLHFLIVES